MIHVQQELSAPEAIFRDRADAGARLAEYVRGFRDRADLVLAVPRGGVPVAESVARALGAALDVLVVRKLPFPDAPEAGFGAIGPDGDPVLNASLVRAERLSKDEIAAVASEVRAEVLRRLLVYRGEPALPNVRGRSVVLVDDGLASGFTMIAAVRIVRRMGADGVAVAVPVSPIDSLWRVGEEADEVYCLVCQRNGPFAVAAFYRRWADLTDDEVRRIVREYRHAAD